MEKALILQIGIASEKENMAKFWWMQGGGVAIDYTEDKLGGYTRKELEQIARARDILSNLDEVPVPIEVIIPAGRYSCGAFAQKFAKPMFHGEDNTIE